MRAKTPTRRDPRLAAAIAAAGWRAGLDPDQIASGLGCTPRHARRLLAAAAEAARWVADPTPTEAPVDLDDEPAAQPRRAG